MINFSYNNIFHFFKKKYVVALKYTYLTIISRKLPNEIVLKNSLAINLTEKRFVLSCLRNDASGVICKVTTVDNAETLKLEQRNVKIMRGILKGSKLLKLIPNQLGISENNHWAFYLEEQLKGKAQRMLDNQKLQAASKLSSKLFVINSENQHSLKNKILEEFKDIFDVNFTTYSVNAETVIKNLADVDIKFCLQHGDFWASNLLFNETNEVQGVIDWDSLGTYYAGFDIFHLFFMNENEWNNLEIGELVLRYYNKLPEKLDLLLKDYYQELGLPIINSKFLVILYWVSFVIRTNKQTSLINKSQKWKEKNIIDVIGFLSKK